MKLRLLTVAILGSLVWAQAQAETAATSSQSQAPAANQTQTVTAQASASNLPASAVASSNTVAANGAATSLKTQKDKISYSIGVDMGQNFKNQAIDIDPNILAQGIHDALAGGKTLMTMQDMQNTLVSFQKQLVAQREANLKKLGDKNKQEGDSYLASLKGKPGVITLPSGLMYKVITDGTGAKPSDQDVVTVNYAGSFTNGQVFDSSYQRGKPVSFPVSQVIPGWTEALKLMKTGATWEIYVPPALAYGEHGLGPIGPNQTLVFKINLVSINKKS